MVQVQAESIVDGYTDRVCANYELGYQDGWVYRGGYSVFMTFSKALPAYGKGGAVAGYHFGLFVAGVQFKASTTDFKKYGYYINVTVPNYTSWK